MKDVDMTSLSSKGQVVIPRAIRAEMDLPVGTRFVVWGEGDTVLLKKVGRPSRARIDALFAGARRYARSAGLTSSGVRKAVQRSRRAG